MATITLKGNTLSAYLGGGSFTSVGNAFVQAKKATSNLLKEINSLSTKIDNASVAANVDTSKQRTNNIKTREEKKKSSLTLAYEKLDELISDTGLIDAKVANKINERKNDFYKKYSYLKPDIEKNRWEQAKEFFVSVVNTAIVVVDWCKEHWKAIVTVVIVVVAVVGLVVLSLVPGGGIIAGIIAGACWGAIAGAVIGGVSGGIASAVNGGSFWEGFENGAFSGAIGGAIGGAITGGFTAALGPAATLLQSIGRGAGIGALSTSISNMAVTTIDYAVTYKTLAGSFDDILISGLSGAITGGIMGGITGGFIHLKSQLKVSNSKYLKSDGKIDWDTNAPNGGRVDGTIMKNQTIEKGTIIDRYGSKYGNYTSPTGTSFEARALPYKENGWAYHKYKVIKDISGVTSSEIAPAFGQPGGGIQFELPNNISYLLKNGFLKEIFL